MKKNKNLGDVWAEEIEKETNLIWSEYLEKHKVIPLNWFTRLILKLKWFRYEVKHYKVKNPIVEAINNEITLWGLLPKEKWKKQSWKVKKNVSDKKKI